jgi:hypothetical protein
VSSSFSIPIIKSVKSGNPLVGISIQDYQGKGAYLRPANPAHQSNKAKEFSSLAYSYRTF